MSLPDVPEGLAEGMFDFLRAMKHAVERVDGEQIQNDKAMTFDDAIAIGLIDESFGVPPGDPPGDPDIPAGAKMYFYANVAPTGWTIDSAIADVVLAIKGGAQAYNVAGGALAGTWTQPSHTLVIAEMPSHRHTTRSGSSASAWHYSASYFYYGGNTWTTATSWTMDIPAIGNTGGGGAHNHGTTYRPYAAVGIIATKD